MSSIAANRLRPKFSKSRSGLEVYIELDSQTESDSSRYISITLIHRSRPFSMSVTAVLQESERDIGPMVGVLPAGKRIPI